MDSQWVVVLGAVAVRLVWERVGTMAPRSGRSEAPPPAWAPPQADWRPTPSVPLGDGFEDEEPPIRPSPVGWCPACDHPFDVIAWESQGNKAWEVEACAWCFIGSPWLDSLTDVWLDGRWGTLGEDVWRRYVTRFLEIASQRSPGTLQLDVDSAMHALDESVPLHAWHYRRTLLPVWALMVLNPGLPEGEARRYLRDGGGATCYDVLPGGTMNRMATRPDDHPPR